MSKKDKAGYYRGFAGVRKTKGYGMGKEKQGDGKMTDKEKEELETVINIPKDIQDIFQEEIKRTRFQREYLGQFIDDNNPEGYKTKDNWSRIDKI